MQFALSLQQLLLEFLMVKDRKAPREILVLLAFLGEMVILAFQDNQDPLVLLAPLESVNHAQPVVRTILPSLIHMMSSLEEQHLAEATRGLLVLLALLVPLVHLVTPAPLVLRDTKVPLVSLDKLVLQVLQDPLVL